MRHAAQTVEQAPVNNALLNVVTPMGLSFERTVFPSGRTSERLTVSSGTHRKWMWSGFQS